jgi:exopolyphosphatase/guanosine-5'-triphosphate,3'-diphosphate pyrophosphatase
MLGTSGTVTTLAAVHLHLERYDRAAVDGAYLTFDDVAALSHALAGMEVRERAANPCIGRQRADLVVAGCAILEAICRTWPVGRLRVADRGLREGILLGLIHAAEAEAASQQPGRCASA